LKINDFLSLRRPVGGPDVLQLSTHGTRPLCAMNIGSIISFANIAVHPG
jgi:hypothetical protein